MTPEAIDLSEDTPGTALALISDMADDKLFSPGAITDAQLATMRSDWLTEAKKYDISSDKARTDLKRFARPLQKLRTGIEARAKELTGATKRKIAAIDEVKRNLVKVVGGIEDEVLAPLTAWEQEEETRTTRLAGEVKAFADAGQIHIYPDTVSLGAAIHELESVDVSTFQEFKVSAESAIAASLKVLKPELERRKKAEADAKELEALRAAEAKRQHDERIAAAAKELADEQVQAAVDAALRAEKEKKLDGIVELVREDQTVRPYPTMEEIVDEPQPFVYQEATAPVEDAPQAFVYPEIPQTSSPVYSSAQPQYSTAPQQAQGGISENHEQAYNREAVEALMGCALTRHEAMSVLTAIVEGRIPHITIQY